MIPRAVLGALILVLLGHEYWSRLTIGNPLLAGAHFDAAHFFEPKSTQWLAMLYLFMYLSGFAYLRYGLKPQTMPSTAGYWKLASTIGVLDLVVWSVFTGICLVTYFLFYSQAADSTDAATLVGGMMLGQGAALCIQLKSRTRAENVRIRTVLLVLVSALAAASFWQPEMFKVFQYRGQVRWSGAWSNPNTYGLLMGSGLVLSLGMLVQRWGPDDTGPTKLGKKWFARWIHIAATLLLTVGLSKSFSRGAWAGTSLGVACLGWSTLRSRKAATWADEVSGKTEAAKDSDYCIWLRRNAGMLVIAALAGLILAFWTFRHGEQAIVRRAFSVGNPNDLSWRNRVETYQGSLQMIADRPWFGFGWNQSERAYRSLYQPRKLAEGSSFGLNDYFVIGTTLGLPCLMLFLAYIWLSFRQSNRPLKANVPGTTERAWLQTTCRAGVLVLLMGFWFDGGLFRLALATPFWILLEMGRTDAAVFDPPKSADALTGVS